MGGCLVSPRGALNSPALFRKHLCLDPASCDPSQKESKPGVQVAKKWLERRLFSNPPGVYNRENLTILPNSLVSCRAISLTKKGNIPKTAQSRSLALYTWAAQTLFLSPGSSIK